MKQKALLLFRTQPEVGAMAIAVTLRGRGAYVAAVLLSVGTWGQPTRVAPRLQEAVAAVLDLFEQHEIVALSEGPHNNQKGHEFRLALVRDPRFGRLVNDVVVDSATPGIKG
jgi:hypothetical protein